MKTFILLIIFTLSLTSAIAQITFNPLDGPFGGVAKDIEINSNGNIFAIVGRSNSGEPYSGNVYRSTTNGTQWTKLSGSPIDDMSAVDIFIDDNNDLYVLTFQKVFKSTDNGATWIERSTNDISGAEQIIKTDDGDLFVIVSAEGVYRSADDGITWVNVSNNLPPANNGFFYPSALIGVGNDVYVGMLNEGVYKSVNPQSSSPSWSSMNAGTSLPDQPASFTLKGTQLYQSNRVGVFYWNGSTWVKIAESFGTGNLNVPQSFNSGGHRIVSGSGNTLYLTFEEQGKVYSTTSATSGPWTDMTAASLNDRFYGFAASGTNLFIGYSRNGLHRSTNSGSSFTSSDRGILLSGVQSMVYTSTGEKIITADGGPQISISSFGNTFSKSRLDGTCVSCGSNTLIKLSNGNILSISDKTYSSNNQGASWTLLGTHAQGLSNATTGNGTKFYAISYNYPNPPNYYVSTNGAVSFSSTSFSGLPSSYELRGFQTDGSSNLYLLVYTNSNNGELYKVTNSTTVANKLTYTGFSQGVDNVSVVNNQIIVLGRNASGNRIMSKSTDAGATWANTTINNSNNTSLYYFMAVTEDVYIGVGGFGNQRIYYFTNNGGADWQVAFSGEQDTQIVGAALDANGYLYASIYSGPVYKSAVPVLRPEPPTNLQALTIGESTVELTWDHDFQYVERFAVQRRPATGGSFVTIDTLYSSDIYFVDEGLTPLTQYFYRVVAVGYAGSEISSELSVTTKDDCSAVLIPDNRSWTGSVDGGAFQNTQIGIRKVNSESYYITDFTAGSLSGVARNGGGTFGQSEVDGLIFENCSEPFIRGSSDVHGNGLGTWNSVTKTLTLSFQIDRADYAPTTKTITLTLNDTDPAPASPTGLAGYTYDNASIKVEWQAGLFDYRYRVHRSTTSNFTPSASTEIDEVQYPQTYYIDNSGLTFGQTYYYKVIAVNQNSSPLTSAPSSQVQVLFSKPQFVPANNTIYNSALAAATSAWADFNNDGFEDLIVTVLTTNAATSETKLYKNTGSDFELVANAFPSGNAYINPSVGDYDNDGLIDVYMTAISFDSEDTPQKYSLFKNNGNFSFTDTNNPDISEPKLEGAFSSSWTDFNKDGKLDLFVANQNYSAPLLYEGNGTGGFIKVTTPPLGTDVFNNGYASWADYDKNGWPDLLLVTSDDYDPNPNDAIAGTTDAIRFFSNANGTFTKNTTTGLDVVDAERIFSYSWGDYDNDLDLDLFAVNQDEESANFLFRNNADGTFQKMVEVANSPTEVPALGQELATLSSAWGDIDNDGDLDLLATKGFFGGSALYRNNGNGSFSKITGELLTNAPGFHISASFADYDKNGFLDVIVGQLGFAGDGPQIAVSNIKLLKNNNTTGNYLEVKLEGTQSNRSAFGARVVIKTGTKFQMREVSSHTGFGSQNSLITHFGIGTSTLIDMVEATWPSGIVQTLTNVAANQIITIVEDNAGPVVQAQTPAPGATNVAVDAQVSITLNEPSIAVVNKKLNVYTAANPAVAVHSVNVTAAVKSGNTYTFTLPANLQISTEYRIEVEAGAFTDVYGNAFAGITPATWSFTTVIPPDVTAPTIAFTPPATAAKGFGTLISPEITVTDDRGTVSSVVISIKKLTAASTTFVDVAATQGTGANANKWIFNISEASHFDAIGTEYFITAKDPANNAVRSPADANATHKLYLTYSANESKIPSDKLGFGGAVSNWKVFAVPFELGVNNSFTSIFDELNDKENKVDYRFLTIQPTANTDWTEYPSFTTITRGQGYFSNIKTPVDILIGQLQAPANSRTNLFTINLKAGWNMVGNPYLTQISWANVKDFNGLTGQVAELHKFNGSTYPVGVQTLDAYEGGFVFAQSDRTVTIPFLNQVASGGRVKYDELSNDINESSWLVKLNVRQGGVVNDAGSVGMAPDARLSLDDYDGVTPPRFIQYLETSFAHPEHFAKSFSRDVVPTVREYTWDFSVNTNLDGEAEIFWDNSTFANGTKEMFLLDVTSQRLIDMRKFSSYTFHARESANFKVYFGENLKIAPVSVVLGKAFPNPTSGYTNIGFSLPDSGGQNQFVTLDILDASGRKVGTIAQGRYQPGFHETGFNAKELNNGFYTYRLQVQNTRGINTLVSKLIIK